MREPPGKRTPPILLMRPSYDWICRVNQKHRELEQLDLSETQKVELDRANEIEFAYCTLRLEGSELGRDEISRLVSGLTGVSVGGLNARAVALMKGLRRVTSAARSGRGSQAPTRDLLVELNEVVVAGESIEPTTGERARAAIDAACLWFSAESFLELHPIEQASIGLLRLIDIDAFRQMNQPTALVAASLFTVRENLPPVIIRDEMADAYRMALAEGTRMNTRPLVELLAESTEASLREAIARIKEGRTF